MVRCVGDGAIGRDGQGGRWEIRVWLVIVALRKQGEMEDAMEGYPVQPRRYGVLKKKKKAEEAEGGVGVGFGKGIGMGMGLGMGMGESVVVPAPRFGVLKKKKMLEVERIEPPPPQPTFDAPRFGVLKKRKAPKPARPNLVLATGRQAAGLIFGI